MLFSSPNILATFTIGIITDWKGMTIAETKSTKIRPLILWGRRTIRQAAIAPSSTIPAMLKEVTSSELRNTVGKETVFQAFTKLSQRIVLGSEAAFSIISPKGFNELTTTK